MSSINKKLSGFVRKSNGTIGVFLVMEVWKIGAVDGDEEWRRYFVCSVWNLYFRNKSSSCIDGYKFAKSHVKRHKLPFK